MSHSLKCSYGQPFGPFYSSSFSAAAASELVSQMLSITQETKFPNTSHQSASLATWCSAVQYYIEFVYSMQYMLHKKKGFSLVFPTLFS